MINRRTFLALAGSAPLFGQLKPPKPAPELTIILNSGEHLLLSRFRGKVVVLEFLLTTCPHCQTCSAIMQKLYGELGDRVFQLLGAAINPNSMTEARMLVPAYVNQLGLKFPVSWTPATRPMHGWRRRTRRGPSIFRSSCSSTGRELFDIISPAGTNFTAMKRQICGG